MSAFKDAVAADVTHVFINADEFADWHDIDGVRLCCVIDQDVTQTYSNAMGNSIEGVFKNTVQIHVRAVDMERPVEGELIRVDGSLHLVESVSDEMGVYVITATENRQ